MSLTPELKQLVDEKVKSGVYQTASEVVRETLRLLKARDEHVRLRADTTIYRKINAWNASSSAEDRSAPRRVKARSRCGPSGRSFVSNCNASRHERAMNPVTG